MEKRMIFVQKLSLEEIALRRVVVKLWTETHTLVPPRFKSFNVKNFMAKVVSGKMKEKVSKLVLPESLKQRMIHLVTPIVLDLSNWKFFHENFLSDSCDAFDVHNLEQLCLTSTGAVDYQGTAKKLVRLEKFDVVIRFELACLYCLEDYIRLLWKELPEESKIGFCDPWNWEYYWGYFLEGEEFMYYDGARLIEEGFSFHQRVFEHTARTGNKAAMEYFYQKLTDEERDASLFRAFDFAIQGRCSNTPRKCRDFPNEKNSDVLCYLLSLMTREQQMKVFRNSPCGILRSFLDWPLQDFFLDIADLIWTFLPESMYDSLLNNISTKRYCFPETFQKFFLRSPIYFRKLFVEMECRWSHFFAQFFRAEDKETIKVVFRNVDIEDRFKLVSCYNFFEHFDYLSKRESWDMIELCLREATLSKEVRVRMKEAYMGFLSRAGRGPEEYKERRWKLFFEYLDETNANAVNRRTLEDEPLAKD